LSSAQATVVYDFYRIAAARESRSGMAVSPEQRLFPDSVSVAGQFDYEAGSPTDALFPFSSPAGSGPVTNFGFFFVQGSIGSRQFAASHAFVVAANDNFCSRTAGQPSYVDCLALQAASTVTVSGTPVFDLRLLGVGGVTENAVGEAFTLQELRLGWVEDYGGTGDFLDGLTVPASLPPVGSGIAALQLIFLRLGDDPLGPVVRQHLTMDVNVVPTPLPPSGLALLTCLAAAWARRWLRVWAT
jgi:hypothetical protein